MKRTMLIFLAAAVMTACGAKVENAPPAAAAAPQIPHEVTAATASVAAPQPKADPGVVSGKVLETMNAGGYTYLRVGTASGDVRAAVRETKIKKGTTVSIAPQMVAQNFESKTLNRKFDQLVMGALIGGEAAAPHPATEPPAAMSAAMGTPAQHMSAAKADAGSTKVDKADGGATIAEVWSGKDSLKDKPVVIRGKVVKFLPDIMGKNWLHLRDGSGDHGRGTDDITVTTNDVAKVGDVVVVRGTLRLEKDFGAGYLYPVIVEDAKVGQ